MDEHEIASRLLMELTAYGYHPILSDTPEFPPEGWRMLFECEGWYLGCNILVPEGEFNDEMCEAWYEE